MTFALTRFDRLATLAFTVAVYPGIVPARPGEHPAVDALLPALNATFFHDLTRAMADTSPHAPRPFRWEPAVHLCDGETGGVHAVVTAHVEQKALPEMTRAAAEQRKADHNGTEPPLVDVVAVHVQAVWAGTGFLTRVVAHEGHTDPRG